MDGKTNNGRNTAACSFNSGGILLIKHSNSSIRNITSSIETVCASWLTMECKKILKMSSLLEHIIYIWYIRRVMLSTEWCLYRTTLIFDYTVATSYDLLVTQITPRLLMVTSHPKILANSSQTHGTLEELKHINMAIRFPICIFV